MSNAISVTALVFIFIAAFQMFAIHNYRRILRFDRVVLKPKRAVLVYSDETLTDHVATLTFWSYSKDLQEGTTVVLRDLSVTHVEQKKV